MDQMKLCLASDLIQIAHKSGDVLGFPGRNPKIAIVPPQEADYAWYAAIGDGEGIRNDLRALDKLKLPLISVCLGDWEYRDCLTGCNVQRHFSCAIESGPNSVPCYFGERRPANTNNGRPILASFRGSFNTHKNRTLLKAWNAEDCVIEECDWWHLKEQEFAPARQRYDWLMQHSKFTLCPRGYGKSSMRLVEAITNHSIPITLDDWIEPFGCSLGFGIRIHWLELGYAMRYIRSMSDGEYRKRLESMDQWAERYLWMDINAGCEGTIHITEWIRQTVEGQCKA